MEREAEAVVSSSCAIFYYTFAAVSFLLIINRRHLIYFKFLIRKWKDNMEAGSYKYEPELFTFDVYAFTS